MATEIVGEQRAKAKPSLNMTMMFLVVGIAELVAAVFLLTQAVRRNAAQVVVRATLVDTERGLFHIAGKTGRDFAYRSTYEYAGGDGRTYKLVDTDRSAPSIEVGDTVAISYLPTTPSHAPLDDFTGKWGPPIFFAVMGAAFILFGVMPNNGRLKAK